MSNIDLAAAAKAAGKTRFTSICKKHGEGDFWAASKRCVRCATEAKTPAVQAAYWEKNRVAIAAKRKIKKITLAIDERKGYNWPMVREVLTNQRGQENEHLQNHSPPHQHEFRRRDARD